MPLNASVNTSILNTVEPRFDWSQPEVTALFGMPFMDLMFRAQEVHRRNFAPNEVQVSTLLSIKTGACPEEKRLITGNPEADKDMALFANLGVNPEKREEYSDDAVVESTTAQVVKQEESKLFYEVSA